MEGAGVIRMQVETTHSAQLLVPAVSGLLGVAIGGWIAATNQNKDRSHRRNEDQLRFYAGLLSLRKVILAKSELRNRLSIIAHKAWKDELGSTLGSEQSELRTELYKQREKEYDQLSDYSDNQLREELIPLYRKML